MLARRAVPEIGCRRGTAGTRETDVVPTDEILRQSAGGITGRRSVEAPGGSVVSASASATHEGGAAAALVRRGLVEIVRDFIAVHRQMAVLFESFREGTLRFDEVSALVADSESSPLFRLKERVHTLFRPDAGAGQHAGQTLRRGEALFDLAVGSLFHEALKFRENFYQLEVYAPRVVSLRDDGGAADELLREFEKILHGASQRVEESLDEAETLLGQLRRQLVVLLLDAREEKSSGLVTRYLITHRDDVEAVYTEGLEALLEKLHDHVLTAYLCAIRSQLESARFDEAIELIRDARQGAAEGAGTSAYAAGSELTCLEAYAEGMSAFLHADYERSTEKLGEWLGLSGDESDAQYAAYALAALSRVPELVAASEQPFPTGAAKKLAEHLAAQVARAGA